MGPRHLVFHPNGKLACLVYELGNIITMFRYADGEFTPLNTLSLLPADFTGHSQAAAMKFSEDGRRVFATNRGHDSVVTFDVDPECGSLSLVASSPLGGSWPRDFTMLPGERIALACLERAGEVRAFRYDAATGGFTPLDHAYRTHRPVVAVL
jgi:6-phosphogluconolactonase